MRGKQTLKSFLASQPINHQWGIYCSTHWMLMRFPSTQQWCVLRVCSGCKLWLLPWTVRSGSAAGGARAAGRCGHTLGWSPCRRPGRQWSRPTENTQTHFSSLPLRLLITHTAAGHTSRLEQLKDKRRCHHYRMLAIQQQNAHFTADRGW